MPRTYQEVDAAANSLNAQYGKQGWFLGVGIGKENDDYIVSMRVSHSAPQNLPDSYNGIPIQIIKQDMPVAL